jgi:hypothetical protein
MYILFVSTTHCIEMMCFNSTQIIHVTEANDMGTLVSSKNGAENIN